jgi:hypothetical protein
MVSIGDLGIATTSRGMSDVIPKTNALQIAGEGLANIGEGVQMKERNDIIRQNQFEIQQDKERQLQEREASGYLVEKGSNLQLSGQDSLEKARQEAESPNKIAESFFERFQNSYDDLAKDAPNEIAKQKLNERFLELRATFGKTAIQTQVDEIQNQRNTALDTSINKAANLVRQGMYDDANLMVGYIYEDAATFKSAADITELKGKISNTLEVARLDGLFEKNNLSEVRTLINKPESTLSAKQQETYRDAIRRQEEKLADMAVKDPVGYLMATNQNPKNIDDVVSFQDKQGINQYNARVMSDDQARDMALQVNNITSPASMTQFLVQLKQNYGKYTPNAVSDLVKQKIPPQFGYMLQMANEDPVKYSKPIELMFDVINTKKEDFNKLTSNNLNASNDTLENFKNKLFTELEDDNQLMANEGLSSSSVSMIQETTLDLAKAHFNKYKNIDDAISFASDTLRNGYDIGDYNGSKFRISPDYNRDSIEGGLEFAMSDINVMAEYYDPVISKMVGDGLKDNGVFVTNADFSGLNLRSEDGDLLRDKGGRVINLKFNDLDKIYRKNKKEIQRVNKKIEADIIMQNEELFQNRF